MKNLEQLKKLIEILDSKDGNAGEEKTSQATSYHPMLNKRCVIRTYSAGVHIGIPIRIKGQEVHLKNSLRLWAWKDGGLSLSAVASNGIKGGRLNKTGEVFLTQVIEFIPMLDAAYSTVLQFIEDDEGNTNEC